MKLTRFQRNARRHYLKRKAEGWKAGGLQLPVEVWDKVMSYKNDLMKQYRLNRRNINEITVHKNTEQV